MKTLKPIMLVVAGLAIAFLVSFKSQEAVREYGILTYKSEKYTFYTEKPESKEYSVRLVDVGKRVEILNELAKDGWRLVNVNNDNANFYFERTR